MQDYKIVNGQLVKAAKSLTVFTASSRGTNCVIRDLREQGESVIDTNSTQIKVDFAATKSAIQTLAAGQFKDENDKDAFIDYVMSVLTGANLFKVEKVVK